MSAQHETLLTLQIDALPTELQRMRHRIDGALATIDLPREMRERLVLAVNEACMNIIQHAYRDKTTGKKIRLHLAREPGLLRFVIEDDAPCIDPGCVKPRELSDVRPGGLGVHFIREIMDDMQFHACGTRGNRLELVKRIDRTETEQ
jgi:anti-sigma regulatory factor (Ser/Thr protein kinase)